MVATRFFHRVFVEKVETGIVLHFVFFCECSLRKKHVAADHRAVQVGSGSFGTTYAAKSVSGGPIVYKRFSVPPTESDQFADEVACHNALRAKGGHPNVLMALKTFHDQNKQEAVILMEAGVMDLRGLLRAMSYCVAAPLAAVLLQDVTRGLAYIHQCGIIHRDLKPCNVILTLSMHQGGRLVARISDFGCSRLQSSRPTETLNFCTCMYRAPEVFELVQPSWSKEGESAASDALVASTIGSAVVDVAESPSAAGLAAAAGQSKSQAAKEDQKRYSFAADIWSIGCIYAEFLHGRVLFQTSGNADVSLLGTIAARIGVPDQTVLTIKGWPDSLILDLAKAPH